MLFVSSGDKQALVQPKEEGLADSLAYACDCGLVLLVRDASDEDKAPLVAANDLGEFLAGGRDY